MAVAGARQARQARHRGGGSPLSTPQRPEHAVGNAQEARGLALAGAARGPTRCCECPAADAGPEFHLVPASTESCTPLCARLLCGGRAAGRPGLQPRVDVGRARRGPAADRRDGGVASRAAQCCVSSPTSPHPRPGQSKTRPAPRCRRVPPRAWLRLRVSATPGHANPGSHGQGGWERRDRP